VTAVGDGGGGSAFGVGWRDGNGHWGGLILPLPYPYLPVVPEFPAGSLFHACSCYRYTVLTFVPSAVLFGGLRTALHPAPFSLHSFTFPPACRGFLVLLDVCCSGTALPRVYKVSLHLTRAAPVHTPALRAAQHTHTHRPWRMRTIAVPLPLRPRILHAASRLHRALYLFGFCRACVRGFAFYACHPLPPPACCGLELHASPRVTFRAQTHCCACAQHATHRTRTTRTAGLLFRRWVRWLRVLTAWFRCTSPSNDMRMGRFNLPAVGYTIGEPFCAAIFTDGGRCRCSAFRHLYLDANVWCYHAATSPATHHPRFYY